MSVDDGLSVDVLRDVAGLAAAREEWCRLCEHPDTHPDVFAALCANEPAISRPHVVIARRGGTAESMAVARVERIGLPVRLGYARVWVPRLRVVQVSYRGVVGVPGSPPSARFVDALVAPVREGEADAVAWSHAAEGSGVAALRDAVAGEMTGDAAPLREVHRALTLPATYDAYVSGLSKSTRGTVRNTASRIRREFGDRLRIDCLRAPEDLDRILRDTDAIARDTYHRALGVGFTPGVRTTELMRASLRAGMFRAYLLYVDDAPRAFWHGQLWRGTFFAATTGYDAAMAERSIGTFLLCHIVEDLIRGGGAAAVDFGFGDAGYKKRLGSLAWDEVTSFAFARRLRPRRVNLARGWATRVTVGVDSLLQRTGLRDRVKSSWRKLLRSRSGDAGPQD